MTTRKAPREGLDETANANLEPASPDAYTPPPPGSDRDKVPDHLLAVAATMPLYISTYCLMARALTEAIPQHPEMAEELAEWVERQHRSCRLTRKQDMAPCVCGCDHRGAAGDTGGSEAR